MSAEQASDAIVLQHTAVANDWVPATMPYGKGTGHQTERVLHSPSTGIFVCANEGCTYTSTAFAQVFAHLGSHTPRVKKPKVVRDVNRQIARLQTTVTLAQSQLDDLKTSLSKKGAPRSTEGMWRDRALLAERRLSTLRNALKEK